MKKNVKLNRNNRKEIERNCNWTKGNKKIIHEKRSKNKFRI